MEQELQEVESLIEEGDLARAQVLCKQLLQKHPTNAHAHERMGDIMRKRYMWEEAAEWYALAAQLQDSEALRAKRADVLQRAKESRRGGVEPHLVDEDTTSRMTLWIGLGAAAMLLVIAAIAFSIFGGEKEPERVVVAPGGPALQGPGGSGIPSLTAPSPVRGSQTPPGGGASRATGGATGAAGAAGGADGARANPQEQWRAQELPRAPQQRAPRRSVTTRSSAGISPDSPDPRTDHDQAVINAISSLTWGDNRPMTGRVDAMVDPFTGYAMISVLIPQAMEEQGLVEAVVRQAWRTARAAVQADEVIRSLTIRMVRVSEDGERVVAFRGNTTRAMLQAVGTDRPDMEILWNNIFAGVWWNPEAGGVPPREPQG
ncbi:MAG TPA: hypothetical protein DEP45_06710 [Armatimonadetes bacterium]|nr:hypothetical protein [Armatimonadota bacterium]